MSSHKQILSHVKVQHIVECQRKTLIEGWKKEMAIIDSKLVPNNIEKVINVQQNEESKDPSENIPCDICGQKINFHYYDAHFKKHKQEVKKAPEIEEKTEKIPCDLCGEEILFPDYENHITQKHSPPHKEEVKKEDDPVQSIHDLFRNAEAVYIPPPKVVEVKKEVPIPPAKIEEPPTTKCEACGMDVPNEEYLTHVESHFQLLLSKAPSESSYLPENETQLVRTPFSGKGQDNTCKICYVDYTPGEALIFLPCLHEYHEHCLLDWLKRDAICPICLKGVYKEIKKNN